MVQLIFRFQILDFVLANHYFSSKIKTWLQAQPHLTLLFVYFLLAVVLTWPTMLHWTTHLPGDGGDDPAIAWNLWWVKYALMNEGRNPFQTDAMFFPIGINLAFYTLTVLNAVTALPVTLNAGVVAASNLHLLFTLVMGGYGAFLLSRYVLASPDRRPPAVEHPGQMGGYSPVWISAVVAGSFYAFASSKIFYIALGQFNIGSSHWIPFTVLYILRTRSEPDRLKNPALAGLFLSLQAWTEMTYASFLLIFIGLYWFYWIMAYLVEAIRNRLAIHPVVSSSQTVRSHLRAALILSVIFILGLSPILAQMLPDLHREGDFLVEGSGFAEAFSADLLGFVIPTMHHPLWGDLIRQSNINDFDKGQHIYLGLVLLGLTLISLRPAYGHLKLRFWLVASLVFALLCLGPVITINGQASGVSGPFTLLQSLPFFKGNRYPSRYSVMLILSLSVIAAVGLMQIRSLWSRNSRLKFYLAVSLITLLFLLEHGSIPLPQSDLRVPAAYQLIAADPNDLTVLDIPFAWRNGFRITGAATTQFMMGQFYQTVHQKKLLQGNTSRNPAFKFQYFTQAPLINSLLALETGKTLPPERWSADRTIAAEVLDFFNIKYIVIRSDQTNSSIVTPQATIPYLEAVFPVEKIHEEAALKIYRVQDSSDRTSELPSRWHIDSNNPLASLYLGEGWGWLSQGRPLTAQRRQTRLLLPLTGAPQHIRFRMRLPAGTETTPRAVYLELNSWRSASQHVTDMWQELSFELPAGVARPGLNDVYLYFEHVTTLPALNSEAALVDVTVLSAGEEVGDFGHIFVNGYEVSPNERGYNIAHIQPGDHNISVASFDTHLEAGASTRLAGFVAPLTDGIIAVAAADEVSARLSQEAVMALQRMGAKGDLRDCFRCSHAIIYDGTGQTFEALDRFRPVGVTTGLGLTEPTIAAVVDWIEIEVTGE